MFSGKKIGMLFLLISGGAMMFGACKKTDTVQKASDNAPMARLTLTKGEVLIVDGESTRPAGAGQAVRAGQTLRTGIDSMAELFVKDQGIVRLSENAEFSIKKVDGTGAEFDQTKGTAAVFLKKIKQDSDFKISTPTSVAAVRGTSFIVEVKGKKEAKYALFDGAIEVTNKKGDSVVMDKKGELSVTDRSEVSKQAIKPLSKESLAALRKMAVFQKTQIEEYNSFIDELKGSETLRSVSEEGDALERVKEVTSKRPSGQDSTGKANAADENLIRKNTDKDPLKIQPEKSFKK